MTAYDEGLEAARYAAEHGVPLPATGVQVTRDGLAEFTVSAEVAARMAEKRVVGASIREEPTPAPVPAVEHVMFHESKTHPGVVWPL